MFVSFIPPTDTEFDNWFCNFATGFAEKWQSWGFTESDWHAVESAWVTWHRAFATKAIEASSARSLAESTIVSIVNQLSSTAPINDSDWGLLGLSGTPDLSSAPTSSPALHLDWLGNSQVTVNWNVITHPVWNWIQIQFRNEAAEWQDVAKVPTSSTPYAHTFEGVGPLQYRARWVSSSDSTGPWSAIGHASSLAA